MRNSLVLNRDQTQGSLRDLFRFGNVRNSVLKDPGPDVYDYLSNFIDIENERSMVMMTKTAFNIYALSDNYFDTIVNFARINDIQRINKFFEAINSKLPIDGIFIGCAETKGARKQRILKKFPPVLAHIYYTFDFIFKRIFPKLPITKKIYFKLTGGRNRVISRTETLGRLYSCGFSIIDEKSINGKLYFVVRKIDEPAFDEEPSYGPICKMRRFGKGGKTINVYKFRTMHPFSEYLQQYIYERNKLQEGGKFKDDFRISTLGKFMRKYWLDELPMVMNLLKGDLKLVGVRPLSKQYLSLYSDELKAKRVNFKPGLIPPFYADLPKTLDEIMDSENRYLDQYSKNPFRTDLKYFFKALNQILIKRARSN
ncbi:MAG TPA: sugar transferase [Bacteroidia bacterium]|nr:sugar transferase [Bacteroidia bacterium]